MFDSWLKIENGYIFRITAIQNLEFILQHGIACRNGKPQDPNFVNIGSPDIISKRDVRSVPIKPSGVLSDYVPFYLAPRSPMLASIFRYNKFPQEDIIYLVSQAKFIKDAKIPFVFTSGHALTEYISFGDDLDKLNIVDWDIMRSQYWNNTPSDNDRQTRRMAEFLVHRHFPAQLITGIGVKSEQVASNVNEILNKLAKTIKVRILADWYY